MPIIHKVVVLVHDDLHELTLESRGYCEDCQFWSMGKCALFDVALPPYRDPRRCDECFKAQAAFDAFRRTGD